MNRCVHVDDVHFVIFNHIPWALCVLPDGKFNGTRNDKRCMKTGLKDIYFTSNVIPYNKANGNATTNKNSSIRL